MGKQEIVNFLRKHRNKKFTARQIAEKTRLSLGSTNDCIMRLRYEVGTEVRYEIIINKKTGRHLYLYWVR